MTGRARAIRRAETTTKRTDNREDLRYAKAREEQQRRHAEMVAEWAAKGHPETACVGHPNPLRDCPAPDVHEAMEREAFE